MNYYERHIGDYLKDTAHLSLLEHGVYGRLLDVYYTRECGIDDASAARVVGARSKEERGALESVLNEFFVLEGGIWIHRRCDREIARYQDKQRKASASANARWKKRETHTERSADAMRTHSEGNAPNHQTPDTKEIQRHPPTPRKRGEVSDFPPGFERFWTAYPRKQAKTQALKAFARLRADDALLAAMLAALAVQALSEQWRRDGGQFIPMPATWLNGRRWEDQATAPMDYDVFAGAV